MILLGYVFFHDIVNFRKGDCMSDLVYSKTEIEQKLEPILKKHGIRYAILFGSYSKGNAI